MALPADIRPAFASSPDTEPALNIPAIVAAKFPHIIRNTYLDYKNPAELQHKDLICVELANTDFPLYAIMPKDEYEAGTITISDKSTPEKIIFNHRGGSTRISADMRKYAKDNYVGNFMLHTEYNVQPDGIGGGHGGYVMVLDERTGQEVSPFNAKGLKGFGIFLGLAGLKEKPGRFPQSHYIAFVVVNK